MCTSLGGISHAQDGQKSANIISNKSTWPNESKAMLATNFDQRWRVSEKEFVLGTDGVVKQEQGAQAEPVKNPQDSRGLHNIDASSGNVAPSGETANKPNDFEIPTGSIAQIGAIQQNNDHTKDVYECGSSPLRAEEVKSLVVQTARKYSVDEVFATAIAWAESDFDQSRNSPKGARGPMQLMPATAARFGVKDICDPAQNIEGGMKYLRFLLDEFQNPLLVAAAYNSGEQRIYQHGGIPPFQETVGYVAKVVNYQLGLPMPSAKGNARPAAPQAVSDASDSGDAGVIAVKKTGKFVGGVMHF
ncbi:lytic transglycosylase domain-containing protein [Sinorhizobium medicae]|uniref:lytic transglycosylase domain-containing protein n=1 Tax=Sinorhizobium medicae TaxID=110321 RepID=UPI001AAF1ADA|nr:lytic transglycosylase domain-containing protein [Sinorhizobium medicae]MBO1965299.1 lytic transglycosylase domain-containing protein [Sinorhizobium medicae]WQO56904.1 lytic transglycosylase domain-containing protein [Sinorhizobium medicae]WQP41156.1 lytic transglycosylase domain-containing protein [Sinorhizobium medicae]